MNILKKFLPIRKNYLLVLTTALFISSCSSHKNDKLTFSSWGSIDEINILKPILSDFTQKTKIEVELIHIPDNYYQKIHMMFASNNEPDVIFMNNLNLPVYADSGVLEDLDSWIVKNSKNGLKDFFPQSVEAMKWKEKVYGLPRDISNLLIFYNKDMFDRYKIPYPQANWNFDTFLETAKKLTKDTNNDNNSDTFGFALDKRPIFWLPFIWSSGGDLLNEDLSKFTLSSPESIEGLQFYIDLRNKYHVAPSEKETGNAKAGQLFAQEKIGMLFNGRWMVPTYRKTINFKWDVIPFPSGKKGSIVDVDASGWCMAKSSEKKEQAWQLIEYLASNDSIKKFSADGLIVPSRIDVANSDIFTGDTIPKNSKAFLDIISTGRPTRTTPNWNEIATELEVGLENVWSENEDLKEASDKISKRVNVLLK